MQIRAVRQTPRSARRGQTTSPQGQVLYLAKLPKLELERPFALAFGFQYQLRGLEFETVNVERVALRVTCSVFCSPKVLGVIKWREFADAPLNLLRLVAQKTPLDKLPSHPEPRIEADMHDRIRTTPCEVEMSILVEEDHGKYIVKFNKIFMRTDGVTPRSLGGGYADGVNGTVIVEGLTEDQLLAVLLWQ